MIFSRRRQENDKARRMQEVEEHDCTTSSEKPVEVVLDVYHQRFFGLFFKIQI